MARVKYRLTCKAEEQLTTYNKDFNKKIIDVCIQDETFVPELSCLKHHNEGGEELKCQYLEVKKLK